MNGDVLKAFYLDVDNQKMNFVDVVDDLNVFYEKLNCSCIDIVVVTINGKNYDVVCDDEALFNEEVRPAIISQKDGRVLVWGNVLLFSLADGNGDLVGLDADRVCDIPSRLAMAQVDAEKRFKVIVAD